MEGAERDKVINEGTINERAIDEGAINERVMRRREHIAGGRGNSKCGAILRGHHKALQAPESRLEATVAANR